jgi:hypothetical protein
MTKEQKLKELSRDQFMKLTGVFVSHIYFDDMVYDDYFESGLTQTEFCKKWLEENSPVIETLNSDNNFHYVIDDDEISCLENEDIDINDLTKNDIINSLSEQVKYWRDTADKQITEYKDIIKKLYKSCMELEEAYNSHKKNSEKMESLLRLQVLLFGCNNDKLIKAYNRLAKQISNTDGDFNDELENGNDDYDVDIKF